jgi:hypothetical protein
MKKLLIGKEEALCIYQCKLRLLICNSSTLYRVVTEPPNYSGLSALTIILMVNPVTVQLKRHNLVVVPDLTTDFTD